MAITGTISTDSTANQSTPENQETVPSVNPKDIDLSLDLPKTEPISTQDWLQEEDKLTQKADIPTIPSLLQEHLPTNTNSNNEIMTITNPMESSLQDDMKIIQDLEATAKTPIDATQSIEVKPSEMRPVSDTPSSTAIQTNEIVLPKKVELTNEPQPVQTTSDTQAHTEANLGNTSTMNLDALLGTPTLTTSNVQQATIPGFPPFPSTENKSTENKSSAILQTTVAPIAPTVQPIVETKSKNVKILFFVVLFITLGFIGYFIINTMFPMGLFNTNNQVSTNTEINDIDATDTIIMTGAEGTGVESDENMSNDTQIATTDSGTTDTHGSADEMFTDLKDLTMDTGDQSAIRISQLTNYVAEGQRFFEEGKASNNTTMMKYGIYIKRKGSELMNRLESGDTLLNDIVPNYLAQFSGYLAQLQALETNALSTSSSTNIFDTETEIPNSLTTE